MTEAALRLMQEVLPGARDFSKTLVVGLALALGALILFGWLADEMLEGDTLRFDEHVRSVVHAHAFDSLTSAMRFFSLTGSPGTMAILSVAVFALFWRAGWVRAAILLAITLGGAALLDIVLKLSFRRLRPAPYFNFPAPNSYSFPSGHALFSFCLFGTLASLLSARLRSGMLRAMVWIVAVMLIALIGFSRIYLGVHYPTDVIGGYIAAFVWVSAVTFADRWHRGRHKGE
jgi:undecaprenyl-diphosphatase